MKVEVGIPFEVRNKFLEIESKQLHPDTCFDYITSFIKRGDELGVVVFVEPAGNVVKYGQSWSEILDWYLALFESQPVTWDYALAGWHIFELGHVDEDAGAMDLSRFDDPRKIWQIDKVMTDSDARNWIRQIHAGKSEAIIEALLSVYENARDAEMPPYEAFKLTQRTYLLSIGAQA